MTEKLTEYKRPAGLVQPLRRFLIRIARTARPPKTRVPIAKWPGFGKKEAANGNRD